MSRALRSEKVSSGFLDNSKIWRNFDFDVKCHSFNSHKIKSSTCCQGENLNYCFLLFLSSFFLCVGTTFVRLRFLHLFPITVDRSPCSPCSRSTSCERRAVWPCQIPKKQSLKTAEKKHRLCRDGNHSSQNDWLHCGFKSICISDAF